MSKTDDEIIRWAENHTEVKTRTYSFTSYQEEEAFLYMNREEFARLIALAKIGATCEHGPHNG